MLFSSAEVLGTVGLQQLQISVTAIHHLVFECLALSQLLFCSRHVQAWMRGLLLL